MTDEAGALDPGRDDIETLADIEKLAALASGTDGETEATASDAPAEGDAPPAPTDASTGDPPVPEGVQSRDGQYVLPWERFEEQQARAQAAEDRAADLEQRLAALEAQRPAATEQGQEPKPADQDDGQGQPASAATIEQRLASMRERYEELKDDDPALAQAYEASLTSLEQQLELRQELDQMRALTADMADAYQRQQQRAQDAMRSDVEQALAANAVASAWLQEQDGVWLQRMQAVEAQMLQVPGSKVAEAQTWPERIQAVVDATHAAYGQSPAAAAAAAAAVPATKPAQPKADESAAADEMPPPASMAGMTGELASQGESDLSRFQHMSAAQILAHFNGLSDDQRQAMVGRLA